MIPALIRKAMEAASGAQHDRRVGHGLGIREFLYVDDAAEAIVLAAEQHQQARTLNIGSDRKSRSGP